jgi:hypothetical protein
VPPVSRTRRNPAGKQPSRLDFTLSGPDLGLGIELAFEKVDHREGRTARCQVGQELLHLEPKKGPLMKSCNAGLIAATVSASVLMTLLTGCAVQVRPYGPGVYVRPVPPPPPAYVVEAAPAGTPPPAPPTVAPAPAYDYAPDSYVWDGYEYVGVWGDQYVYWGGGDWLICDPIRLGRFHGWEARNPGWRSRAIPYRHDRLPRR